MIMKLIKIKELNIEVMRTEETSLYKNSKVPKGWKRIPLYQLIYVLESKYRKEFLRELEGKSKGQKGYGYPDKDIKEFIKRLKREIPANLWEEQNQEIVDIIDKLAGDKFK